MHTSMTIKDHLPVAPICAGVHSGATFMRGNSPQMDIIRQIQAVRNPLRPNEWEQEFLYSLFGDLRAGILITERQSETLTNLWMRYVVPFAKQKRRKWRRKKQKLAAGKS